MTPVTLRPSPRSRPQHSLPHLSRLARSVARNIERDADPNGHAPTPKGTCQVGHDLNLPGARKLVKKGDGRWFWRCMICRTEQRAEERRQARERSKRRETERKRAREQAREQARERALGTLGTLEGMDQMEPPGPRISVQEMVSPFAVAQRALEAHWGLPIARWTQRHHQIHTRAMYYLLGWPKDGPPRHTDFFRQEPTL